MTDPNTPATPVSTPASAQGVPDGWKLVPIEPTETMRVAGELAWMSRDLCRPDSNPLSDAYRAMLSASPAPSRDAAVPASGGVDVEAFHEAFELIFEVYASPADVFQTDTAWAMSMSRKVNKAYGLLQKVRASLSPAPTSGSEAGGVVAHTPILPDPEGVPSPKTLVEQIGYVQAHHSLPEEVRALLNNCMWSLAKPASEPAGGGLREVVARYLWNLDDVDALVRELAALSSAPATPSPAEAEAKEGRS